MSLEMLKITISKHILANEEEFYVVQTNSFSGLILVGVDIDLMRFMNRLDDFPKITDRYFYERKSNTNGKYDLFSLLIIALLDLGLNRIKYLNKKELLCRKINTDTSF